MFPDPYNNFTKINGHKIVLVHSSSNCNILIKVVQPLRNDLNMSV